MRQGAVSRRCVQPYLLGGVLLACVATLWFASYGNAAPAQKPFVLKPGIDGLTLSGTKAEAVDYRGKKAIHLSEAPGAGEDMALVKDLDFKNGTIELEIAGAPSAGAPEGARGFVGIAFRLGADSKHFECVYLRPTNGRADDQLRRNHSTQYISAPDYPWERLRKENPGVYEAYVDLESGAWTKYKLVVSGNRAALYINGAEQPCLIVNDLKGAEGHGKIALWIGPNADGYFSGLKVTPAP
jgi:hypothetical protein